MGNASNALLIAGGVLIALLIISLAVFMFNDFGSKAADINAQNDKNRLTAYNMEFTSYLGYYVDEKQPNGTTVRVWKTTIYDLITLRGKAQENNKNYEATNDEERIDVKINNVSILEKVDTDLINAYTNSNGELTRFKCSEKDVKYNKKGKIQSINFTPIQ